jgi:SAM-dependent methyltransferase
MSDALLIFYLRPARRKARSVAIAEALSLLQDLHAVAPGGGPLSEQGGLFWVALPADAVQSAINRMPGLGYTYAIDLLEPAQEKQSPSEHRKHISQRRGVHWQGKPYHLIRVYEEDAEAMRARAPDRRVFLLETHEHEVRAVQGYRGDGQAFSRRGLPVYDARLLVNLVFAGEGTYFLDPFAGIGGIVIEALASGCIVVSSDRDPALRHGLAHLGAQHHVADARRLPFAAEVFDAIATEPPYDEQAMPILIEALHEMYRVLKTGGRLALLCAASQAEELRREAGGLGLKSYLDSVIDRKGLEVVVLAWEKEKRGSAEE